MKPLMKTAPVFVAIFLAYASPSVAGDNTVGGTAAGEDLTTGTDNTIIGTEAGVAVTTGTDNTLLGYESGKGVTGSHNIILGEDPSSAITTGGSNILVGNSLTEVTHSSSGQLDIGDTLYGTLGGSGTITAANNFTALGTIIGNLFSGSGASLTSLNGSNISSGTVAAAYLPTGTVITTTGSPAQGDILYFNGSNWVDLAAGTSGYFLKTQGASANPTWAVAGNGTVNSGTQYDLGYYAATGTAISGSSAITTDSGGDLTSTGTITGNLFSGSGASLTSLDGSNISSGTVASAYLPTGTVITTTASPAQGDVLYYNGSNWVDLAAGTSGQFLETQGASANPKWATGVGSGVINSGTQYQLGYYASTGTTMSGDANLTTDSSNDLNIVSASAALEIAGDKILNLPGSSASNIGVGYQALLNNTTATNNTALGAYAMHGISATPLTTTADNNTAVGYTAMYSLQGSNPAANVAVGNAAAYYMSTAAYNTAIGSNAMEGVSATPLTGYYNTVVGDAAMNSLQGAADNNTAVGYEAGYDTTTGTDNTLVGYAAGIAVTGSSNIMVGEDPSHAITSGSSNILIGNSLTKVTNSSSHQIDIGDVIVVTGAGTPSTSSTTVEGTLTVDGAATLDGALTVDGNATVDGTLTVEGTALNISSSSASLEIGSDAILSLPDSSTTNIAVGYDALLNDTTAVNNTAVGAYAMNGVSATPMTGTANNTAVGYTAMYSLRGTALDNTVVGNAAAYYMSTGSYNSAFGTGAMEGASASLLTGDYNVAVGYNAMNSLQGAAEYDTAVGASAGDGLTTGTDNTMIGWEAGYDTTTGTDNTLVGYAAGIAVTGSSNIMVGEDPSHAITSGSSNILIGNSLTKVTASSSNQIDIGDVIVATGAGTPSTSSTTVEGGLTVDGGLTLSGIASSTTGDYVCANGSTIGKGTTCTLSDENAKQDIVPLTGALAEVKEFQPVQFRYKDGFGYDSATVHVGFTAQRMAKVDPRVVVYDKGSPHAVAYENITAINSAAIQEQQKEIDELKAQLKTLRAQQAK